MGGPGTMSPGSPGSPGSPRSPGSPKLTKISSEQAKLQIQQFLDEWHHVAVEANMIKTWDRPTTLRLALEVLELNGCAFKDREQKEALLQQDESVVIAGIVKVMPQELRKQFDVVRHQVLSVMRTALHLRSAIDAQDNENVRSVFEAADTMNVRAHMLTEAVVHSSNEAMKMRRVHATWTRTSEDRVVRLKQTAEEAEHSQQLLLAVQAQLQQDDESQKTMGKGILMQMASGSVKALIHAAFSGWFGLVMFLKMENAARREYAQKLHDVTEELAKAKAQQTELARSFFLRMAGECSEMLKALHWATWVQEVKKRKIGEDDEVKLREIRAEMKSLQATQLSKARRVLIQMIATDDAGMKQVCWTAWVEGLKLIKKEQSNQEKLDEATKKMTAQVLDQKSCAGNVLVGMVAQNEEGLTTMVLNAWKMFTQEELRTAGLDREMNNNDRTLRSMNTRQKANAAGVQGRVVAQISGNIIFHFFYRWLYSAKTAHLASHFSKKLDSKRRRFKQGQQCLPLGTPALEVSGSWQERRLRLSRTTGSRHGKGYSWLCVAAGYSSTETMNSGTVNAAAVCWCSRRFFNLCLRAFIAGTYC
eukprot:TRINITY_DN3314_c3_g1_i4.p1 TRINITY_DN3314_c3_g1~~TRINITY_DN3314_c3_g1_i4.p1  ORF type:complete len:590 (-),score=132.22 TRINITY_DN3314_c3_g1_i4:82-1851(-)